MEWPSIEALNKRFGAAGRVAFREGPGGWPLAVLAGPTGACEVSLYGGQVLSYRAIGFQDALWLSPLARFEEGVAIRGGIPVCWPWFGKPSAGFPEGTPAHGYARVAPWHVEACEYDARETRLTLGLSDAEATGPAFPYAYRLTLEIALGDCLRLDLQTRNLDREPFTYGEALHTYLRVADARHVRVVGIGGKTLRFDDATTFDEVFSQEDVVAILRDPVSGRDLALSADDAAAAVVWHPSLEDAPADVPLEGPRRFVCIEPANPHHTGGEITLKPGQAHTLTLRVQPLAIKEEED